MPTQKLTDRVLATGVTLDDLIHIVIPSDPTENPAGSSFKATIQQVVDLVSGVTEPSYIAITITPSDILSSNSVPFEILPSPGTKKYYDLKIIVEYQAGVSNYVSGNDTVITDLTNYVFTIGDISIFSTDSVKILQSMNPSEQMKPDSPLYFYTRTSDPTAGDGEITLKIWYTIRTLGLP